MPEQFILSFLNTVFSQYGALVCAEMFAIWWLAKQLSEEKKAHAETRKLAIEAQKEQSDAASETAKAISVLSTLIQQVLPRGSK